jgi:sialate O-acetylesterase
MTMRVLVVAVILLLSSTSALQAADLLASLFSDHMVLQRDASVPIWGDSSAGDSVTVSFAGQDVSATADANGHWRVELKPLTASADPRSLTVTSKSGGTVTARNVLVGDVWVGSGQSNMAGRVASYAKNDETLAKLAGQAPFANIRLMQSGPKPVWAEASAQAVDQFSALLLPFGERLQRELDVPIGLIVGAVGGTPSGQWIPPQTFASSKKCKTEIAEFAKTYDAAAAQRAYENQLAAWEKLVKAAEAKGEKPRGRKPLPPQGPGSSSRGGKIGGLYERYIEPVAGYRIQGVLWDQGEARSGVVGVDQYTMMSELIRGWREAWGQGEFPFLFVQKPSGGGNAFSNDDPITRNGNAFVNGLPQITRLGDGVQRFLYVRLMRDNANAWMVPASDLGSGIHPTNKWGYGNRAAEVALSQVYKSGVQAYGPMYRSHSVDGSKVIVSFDHVGKGLAVAHSERLQGFAIAGEDGNWQWADAKIDGDTVVLTSAKVPQPKHVRYAWAQNRAWANLFNKDGLPALVFTTGE